MKKLGLILAISMLLIALTPTFAVADASFVYPVLFIHGLGGDSSGWDNVKSKLSSKGYEFGGNLIASASSVDPLRDGDFYTIDIPNTENTTFNYLGEIVEDAVRDIRSVTGARKVILVGHSLGGIASRAYLNTYPGDVAALLTIATPHGGSFLGYADEYLDEIKKEKKLSDIGLAFYCKVDESCKGSTADALEPDSPELLELNSVFPPQDVLYLSIIGTSKDYESIPWYKNIKEKFLNDYTSEFTKHYSGRNVSICSPGLLINFTDNVVPVCSQYLFSLFPAKDYDHREFYLDGLDHTRQTRDLKGVNVIIEALEYADNYLR